jgi:hypothetical protein
MDFTIVEVNTSGNARAVPCDKRVQHGKAKQSYDDSGINFLLKPVMPSDLLKEVRRILDA